MKSLVICLFACLLGFSLQAQKTTRITAVAHGYTGKVIDFEFMDNTALNKQFPFAENQKMEFEVKLKEPSLMKINIWVWVMVCPGEDVELDLTFVKTSCHEMKISGGTSTLVLNETVRDCRRNRLMAHYKTNPLAAVVTQIPVRKYYEDTKSLWQADMAALEKVKASSDPKAYNYVRAELEGVYLSNLVKYPYIVEDVLKKDISRYIPDDFWTVLDNYEVKEDAFSLKSYSYMKWLLDYKEYADRKAAREAGRKFEYPTDLQAMYDSIVEFYDGGARDAALYIFLYDAIAAQKDFDVLARLSKDYFKKYNKNRKFRAELQEMQK